MTQSNKIDFRTFVLSLAASAEVNLAKKENPETKKKEMNLLMAEQTIAILDMLQEKTRNNLESHESELLGQLLHDLKMQYVEAKKGQS